MTMSEEREKLLDRILKLHRKAESAKAIGSEAEAMIFAEAVQRMLLKHDLELSDVEYEVELAQDPVKMHGVPIRGKKRKVLWTTVLVNGIAKGHLCASLGMPNTDAVLLVGRRQHRLVAEFMIKTLVKLAEELADKAYVKFFYACQAEGDVTQARGFRDSFLTGFAVRVHDRYENLMLETREQVKQPGALIRISKEVTMVQQVLDELRQADALQDANPKMPDVDDINLDGLIMGAEAGDQVALRAKVVTGGTPAPKSRQLGAGQRLLP